MYKRQLHGHGQFVGPPEGRDKEGDQQGDQGFGLLEEVSGVEVGAPRLLGGHDLVGLLDQGGDEPELSLIHICAADSKRVTVGPGVPPDQLCGNTGRGLYRRSGFSPCPEDIFDSVVFSFFIIHGSSKNATPFFVFLKNKCSINIDLPVGIY